MSKIAIIGSGPSGLSAGINLLNKNPTLDITIFEKGKNGKDKICGDVISHSSIYLLEKLGFSKSFLFKSGYLIPCFKEYDDNFNINYKSSGFLTIKRKIFDNLLREKFLSLGGKIIFNSNIQKIFNFDDRIDIFLNQKQYSFDVIIISTGIDISLLKNSGFDISYPNALALRCYCKVDKKIDFASNYNPKELKKGYFWAYPSGENYINFGIGKFDNTKLNLKNLFLKCLDEYSKKFDVKIEPQEKIKFWPLKTGFKENKYSYNRVLLAGEVIGTTFNKSGEGIFGAIFSGISASNSILNVKGNFTERNLRENYDLKLMKFSLKPKSFGYYD